MNKIDKYIYELFARKELSEGCKVKLSNPKTGEILDTFPHTVISHSEGYYTDFNPRATRNKDSIKSCEILGHEPQLHDMFRVAKEKGYLYNLNTIDFPHGGGELLIMELNKFKKFILYNPTLTLLQQSDETKSQLISLFS